MGLMEKSVVASVGCLPYILVTDCFALQRCFLASNFMEPEPFPFIPVIIHYCSDDTCTVLLPLSNCFGPSTAESFSVLICDSKHSVKFFFYFLHSCMTFFVNFPTKEVEQVL